MIEQALYISLDLRLRPDGAQFYAVDRDPSIDMAVPVVQWISGLDNSVLPVPGGGPISSPSGAGAGPNGTYNSSDIRAAYASCAAPTGAGQSVGLFEFDGFTANDISAYECVSGGATCVAGVPTSAVPAINTIMLNRSILKWPWRWRRASPR